MRSESLSPSTGHAQKVASYDPRVWLLGLGTFAIGTDAYVVAGILPELMHDLHLTLGAAGQVVTSYSLTYALSSPFLSAFVGHVGKRRLAVTSLMLFALANILCATASGYAMLLAARIFAGATAGLFVPTAYTLAATLALPAGRSKALGAVAMGLSSATAIGVPIGASIGQRVGWHGTFVLVAALAIVAAFVIARQLRFADALPQPQAPSLMARFKPLSHGTVLLALSPVLLMSTGYFVLYTYLSAILRARGIEPSTVTLVFLAAGTGGVTSSVLGGQLSARYPPTIILACAFAVLALDAAVFDLFDANAWSAAAVSFVLSLSGWLFLAPQQTRLLSLVAPDQAQVTLALNGSCIYLGAAAGAAIGGWLVHGGVALHDLHWATVCLAVAAAVALAASAWQASR